MQALTSLRVLIAARCQGVCNGAWWLAPGFTSDIASQKARLPRIATWLAEKGICRMDDQHSSSTSSVPVVPLHKRSLRHHLFNSPLPPFPFSNDARTYTVDAHGAHGAVFWEELDLPGYAELAKKARAGHLTIYPIGPVRSHGQAARRKLLVHERIIQSLSPEEKQGWGNLSSDVQQIIARRCGCTLLQVKELLREFEVLKRRLSVVAGWRRLRLSQGARSGISTVPAWDILVDMDLDGYLEYLQASLRGQPTLLFTATDSQPPPPSVTRKLEDCIRMIKCIPPGQRRRPLHLDFPDLELIAVASELPLQVVVAALEEFCSMKRLPLRLADLQLEPDHLPATAAAARRLLQAKSHQGDKSEDEVLEEVVDKLTLDRYCEYLEAVRKARFPSDPLQVRRLAAEQRAALAAVVRHRHIIRCMAREEKEALIGLGQEEIDAIANRAQCQPEEVVQSLHGYLGWVEATAQKAVERWKAANLVT